MALGTPTPTLIHQGSGYLYLNVCAPASGKRHLIGSDGTPTQPAWSAVTAYSLGQMIVDASGNVEECTTAGTSGNSGPTWPTSVGATVADGTVTWTLVAFGPAYKFAGALEGVTELDLGAKIEALAADQETLPIDAVMTGEAETLSVTLKESDAAKLQLLVAHGTYAQGTDTSLPTGAQAYEEIAVGGLQYVPRFGVLFISKRRDQSNKFVVSQLYKAYVSDTIKLPFQRGKETTYKVTFTALAAVSRPLGDRGGKIYRQT